MKSVIDKEVIPNPGHQPGYLASSGVGRASVTENDEGRDERMQVDERRRAQFELDQKLRQNMARIKHKILVLSNKGGVGKSSVAVNLAAILSKKGSRVGILDADIHGPSIAKMLGFEGRRLPVTQEGMAPIMVSQNLWAISMASLIAYPDMPVIWRGPLKTGALKQFLGEVLWGELDYLIMDSPPGTGDEPLSVCQLIPELDGGIIVTTPQEVALSDSRKCVNFLRQLKTPVLGIIENMSGFKCPHCGADIELFGSGGGERAALELGVPFLGKIPIDLKLVVSTDEGKPLVDRYQDSEAARAFEGITQQVIERIESGRSLPKVSP